MHRPSIFGPDIFPIKSDGTKLDRDGVDVNQAGYTLASGQTYYYPLGRQGKEAPYLAFGIKWDAAAILTITLEDTCFPDVTDWDTTPGNWEKENPPTAYIAADGGATVTNATVSVPGGTAGGAVYNIGQMCSLRQRIKIVVGGTGGVVRVAQNAKD